MKRLTTIPLLFFALLGAPLAAAPWSESDTALEATYLVFHAVDWGQTLDIAARGDVYHEINPILGRHPARADVNLYFALTGVAHIALARWLDPPYRQIFQIATIALEAAVTAGNHTIGLRMAF